MQRSPTRERVVSARRTQVYSSSSKKHILHQLYCVWACGRARCEKRSCHVADKGNYATDQGGFMEILAVIYGCKRHNLCRIR